jgi:hypothetical protein
MISPIAAAMNRYSRTVILISPPSLLNSLPSFLAIHSKNLAKIDLFGFDTSL